MFKLANYVSKDGTYSRRKKHVPADKTCFSRQSMFKETKQVPEVKGRRVP
jgi:hypothetical protein